MNGQPGMLAAEVRLLRQDQLDESLSGGLGLQRVAEMTHLPTGIASTQIESIEVPAGGSAGLRRKPDDDTLLHVVAGQARIRWGANLARETPAGPGDTVLVPAGTSFRADNASPSATLQFILVRGAG
jgi:uncharacterized RmlC-like cupin family protein